MKKILTLIALTGLLCSCQTDEKELYIEPTLLKVTDLDSPVMNNEIFGPILPIIEFEDKKDRWCGF